VEKNTYTYDEAYEATLEYFGGDELAARVWVSKYALKDSFFNIPNTIKSMVAIQISSFSIDNYYKL